MRKMFGLMDEVGGDLNDYLLSMWQVDGNSQVYEQNLVDVFTRFSVDNIASCAFGLKANSLQNPKNDFGTSSRNMFRTTFYRACELVSVFFIPELVPWFKFKVISNTIYEQFKNPGFFFFRFSVRSRMNFYVMLVILQ